MIMSLWSTNHSRTSDRSSTLSIGTETLILVTVAAVVVTSTAGVIVRVGGWQWLFRRRRPPQQGIAEEQIRWLQQQRKEERTGRIRAEVRLRTTLKQLQQLQLQLRSFQQRQHPSEVLSSPDVATASIPGEVADRRLTQFEANEKVSNGIPTTMSDMHQYDSNDRETMLIQCIGTVVSPFTKRMGTPRQGALVPASRGFVQFKNKVPAEIVSGLELFSHIWIIFEFHANTDLGSMNGNSTKKTKVRPPRGGGIKVGQLATRSPHRPNPIGLSLVTVNRWDPKNRRLYISGLDLVNGTPVYDIKPVVPWDIPGYFCQSTSGMIDCTVLRVPDWVSCDEDVIEHVSFNETAEHQLRHCLSAGKLAPLYTDDIDGMKGATDTILQILAQDPRSSHKGLKMNARGTKVVRAAGDFESAVTNDTCYSLILCHIKLSFLVTESGCKVVEVTPIEFEENQYVDGIPLITEGVLE
jgi:tRNA (adenine37-N6)-methyltransferase